MTDTQKKIYAFILKFHEKYGEVPNARIVKEHFGFTRQAAEQHYKALIKHKVMREKKVYSKYELSPQILFAQSK